jgi:hypothetical protein
VFKPREIGEASNSTNVRKEVNFDALRAIIEERDKDSQKILSPQISEKQQIHENSPEKDLQGSQSPQDSSKPKTREYYLNDFLSERLKAVSQSLDPSEQRNSQEIQGANLSNDDSKLEYVNKIPIELKWDIFLKSFLPENFLDIYENKHDRCAAIEFLEKECSQSKEHSQSVAQKFVEMLTDVRLENNDSRDIRLRMISAIGRSGDKSVVPELLNKLSSQRLHWSSYEEAAIAGVAVMLDPQLAVPKLLEKLSDGSLPSSRRTIMAFAIGMSKDRSAVSKLHSIHSSDLNTTNENLTQAITSAIEMLESPSFGSGLVKVLSDERIDKWVRWNLPYIAGKSRDILVARELVNMLSWQKWAEIATAVGEIGSRLSNPEEIKALADNLLNVTENFHGLALTQEISKAVGELGKKLKTEKDVKELSNKLVAKLFDKRTPQEATPSIANVVFDLELHLAEPDHYKRFFNLGEGRKNACEKIKEELLKYKQEFAKEGKDISEFYEMLSKVAFSDDIRGAMRIRVFRPIMKTAGPSFAPKLKELSAIQH